MQKQFKFLKRGSVITVVISCLILYLLLGNLTLNLNSRYFGAKGDGLKAYYGAMYHTKYDNSYFHFEGMNYPYGEHVVYTGNQNVIANTIKLIKPVADISDYTVGVMNSIMLLSIVVCALLLYLIFKELKIETIYAIIAAIGMTFLSPQLGRLSGHYTLSYVFVIPFIIYQLILYEKNKRWRNSIYLSIGLLLLMLMHPYFFPIAAILIVSQFIVLFFFEERNLKSLYTKLIHLFIQLLLPIILFQLILLIGPQVDDRTLMPWGFWECVSNSTGVFFPYGKPYEWMFRAIAQPMKISWEGVAYVGLLAILVLISMSLRFIWQLVVTILKKEIQKKGVFYSEHKRIILWLSIAGVLGMAISFAFPFNLGLKYEFGLFNFIKQFRGIGRMNWIFFYAINIVIINWLVYHLKKQHPLLKYSILSIAVILLFLDAGYHSVQISKTLNNENKSFSDYNYDLAENNWLKHIHFEKYQAILPLPFFHIGSENIKTIGNRAHHGYVFNVSLLTGLPTTGSILSRTSMSQAIKNTQLHQKPYRKLAVLKDLNSKKPFLIVADTTKISENEKYILNHALLIGSNTKFQFYELSYNTLSNLYRVEKELIKKEVNNLPSNLGFCFTKDSSDFVFESYKNNTGQGYVDKGVFNEKITDLNLLKKVKFDWINEKKSFKVSFWINNINQDLVLRSNLSVWEIKPSGEKHRVDYRSISDRITAIDGSWGLFEYEFTASPNQEFIYYYVNEELKEKENVEIDAFLIRQSNSDVYYNSANYFMKNNRYFYYY